jgi:hypothetical protein
VSSRPFSTLGWKKSLYAMWDTPVWASWPTWLLFKYPNSRVSEKS